MTIRAMSEIDEQVSIARQCGVEDPEILQKIQNAKDINEARRIKRDAILNLD